MIISTISNEEATIRSFMRDPEFAEYFLKDVIADGNLEEIREVKEWIDEARARVRGMERETELAVAEG